MAQPDLQRNGAFHVRPTVIDGLCDRQQLLKHLTGLGVILRLTCVDQLNQQLRCDVAVTDKQSVNVEHGRQQPFVMARQDLQVRLCLLQFGNFNIPALHVAHAILGRDDPILRGNGQLGVQIVGRLGRIGILEQNALKTGGFPDRLVAVLRCAFLEPEAQPAVVGINQRAGCTCILALAGFFGGNLRAFAGDAGHNRDIDGIGIRADEVEAFAFGQERPLARVAEDHEGFHVVKRREPFGNTHVGVEVDVAVFLEGRHGGGAEAAHVHRCHVLSFWSGRTHRFVAMGTIVGTFTFLHCRGLLSSAIIAVQMRGPRVNHRTNPKIGRVTLHDVAAAAGVSKSTVSRMLDERLPSSDSAKAVRVRQIAQDLGYVRDVSAASLRRGETGMIGVIVPRLTDTVMAMLYESLSKAAIRAGKFTIVASTEDDPDAVRASTDALLRRGVDGLVLATAHHNDVVTRELADRGVPYVLTLRTDGVSLSAVGDDRMGGYLATRHLIDLGHTRIGLIAGPDFASSATGRKQGYLDALAEADIAVEQDLIIPSSFGIDAGVEATATLLALDKRPTAIFAVNDNTAIGALSCLTKAGVSVPQQMSLVGYNDVPIVSHLPTPLTSVRVPFDQIAMEALDLLSEKMNRPGDAIRMVPPTLIPRKSTARI